MTVPLTRCLPASQDRLTLIASWQALREHPAIHEYMMSMSKANVKHFRQLSFCLEDDGLEGYIKYFGNTLRPYLFERAMKGFTKHAEACQRTERFARLAVGDAVHSGTTLYCDENPEPGERRGGLRSLAAYRKPRTPSLPFAANSTRNQKAKRPGVESQSFLEALHQGPG